MQVPNLWTSSLLGFTATKPPTFVTLRSHIKVSDHLQLLIFVAATRFYQCLIVDLAPIDACVVRRYNTSQISQGITHKSSKGLQNVARISLLYVDKLEWNPKRFRGLGLDLKFCRILKQGLSLQKRLGFQFNLSTYKRETLVTFWRPLEDLCVTPYEIWEMLYLLTTQASTGARSTIKHW